MMKTYRQALVKQFHHPRGLLGRLAGWIMATRQSNLERNRWTVDLMDLSPEHHVLELGPGPGVTLSLILQRVSKGSVTAVDHSALMLRQCSQRNADAVDRLHLIQADFPGIPEGAMYDRIVAVNSLQFDAMNAATFMDIASHLKPLGQLAVTFQPRGANPTSAGARKVADNVVSLMQDGGLEMVKVEQLDLLPVCAICVIGSRAA